MTLSMTLYVLFMYYSCIFAVLLLLFICVRFTRDLINATYLLTYLVLVTD